MRILQVNKFHYFRGGADKYYLELGQALENAGHDLAYFSMHHPENLSTPWSKYFVSRLSFNEASLKDKLKTPGRVIYSLEAKRKFKAIVKDFKPDIIHLHNIYHQISPSILGVAKKAKIPVVMHLHDYKLICPNYQLFAHGQICEKCKPNKYGQCFKNRCFKNSYSKSLLASIEMHLHHNVWQIYRKNIDLFIAPSQFMKNKLIEFGWPKEMIKIVINPFSSDLKDESNLNTEKKLANYLLFFGRLSKEKGLETLIKASALTKEPLKILGRGPELDRLKYLSKELEAKVEFLGFKTGSELKELIRSAKAVAIPSIWYENMPLSMLEALSLGKPVLASRIGGLPEIIKPGLNGFLFEAGNEDSLVNSINDLNKSDLNALSEAAKESVKSYSPEQNLQDVLNIYSSLV